MPLQPPSSVLPLLDVTTGLVREAFMVKLPHEGGFNPGLVRWRGRLLMAWREGWHPGRLWIGELDSAFRLSWAQEMDFGQAWEPGPFDGMEDPRLIADGDRLLLAFTQVHWDQSQERRTVRMALGELNEAMVVTGCVSMGRTGDRYEKNWQFFGGVEGLKAVYHSNPHSVGECREGSWQIPPADGASHPWAWGEVRGGTPPVLVDGEWFSFFHSSRKLVYYGGFYGFEASAPHRVTRWPVAPCLRPGEGGRVVFPGGAVYENGEWLLAYGWNDAHCCLVRCRHEDLLAGTGRIELSPLSAGKFLPRIAAAFPCVPLKEASEEAAELLGKAPEESPVAVKLVTAFADLSRYGPRLPGQYPPDYVRLAAELFSFGGPLVAWLDCDAQTEAHIRQLAERHPAVEVRAFRLEETETWKAVMAAGDVEIPREHNPVKDTIPFFIAIHAKAELVARSIREGLIPHGMQTGWVDFGITKIGGMGTGAIKPLQRLVRSVSDRIRVPGITAPDESPADERFFDAICWQFCGGFFVGPGEMVELFAAACHARLLEMLAQGRITWEGCLWISVFRRHPEWLQWYRANWDVSVFAACPGYPAPPLAGLRNGEIGGMHDRLTVQWLQKGIERAGPLDWPGLIAENHRHNFILWHEEDLARRDDQPAARIEEARRTIERHNQARNGTIEMMDLALAAMLPPPAAGLPVHSESPGMIIDRLSNMALRESQLTPRPGTPEPSIADGSRRRLDAIRRQRQRLESCLQELMLDLQNGTRDFLPARTMRISNDPDFTG